MSRIVLYSRARCPLCDEARAVLDRERIEFDEVDISSEEALEAEYGQFVPVVEVSGRIVFHAGMNPEELPEIVGSG